MPAPRRILIDPQIYDCLNMGGVAMAQGLVARLRARWPEAELCVLTESPEALATVLPGTVPVPHGHFRRWTGDRFLLGPLFRVMPDRVARQVIDAQRGVELRYPAAMGAARRARMYFAPAEGPAYRSFLATLRGADLVIISGSSGPSEAFPATLRATLALLDLARTHGVPSAMVSQGASEVTMPSITTRLRETLAHVPLVLLRERVEAPARFAEWGLPPGSLGFGGDDAIPQAFASRPESLGTGLGVNLRVAAYTNVGTPVVERTRGVFQAFARGGGGRPVPLPIALHERSPDHEAIRAILDGLGDAGDGGASIRTPAEVIAAAGRCRVVVTGAYHAAVFALAQGIPVVAVAASAMYVDKFRGLEAEFGDSCRIVAADVADYETGLGSAMAELWASAERRRPALLQAAERLVREGEEGFERVVALVRASHGRHRASRPAAASRAAEHTA